MRAGLFRCILAGAVTAGSAAMAEDSCDPKMIVPSSDGRGDRYDRYDWSGLYGGLEVGGIQGKSNQISGGLQQTGANISNNYNVNGVLIGGAIGYNEQFDPLWLIANTPEQPGISKRRPKFVIGGEADFTLSEASGSGTESGFNNPTYTISTKEHWSGTARMRLGFTPWDRLLVYGTFGAAISRVEGTIFDLGQGTFALSDSKLRWGYVFGGGVELALAWENWSIKFEYLHIDYQGRAYWAPPPNANVNPRSNLPLNEDRFMMGINYRFLPAPAHPAYK